MFSRDKWNEVIEALTSNVFRTILTAFGVFWGIFILTILLAAGKGLEIGVKKGFEGTATNTMVMFAQSTSKAYDGFPKGRRYNFKLNDVEALKSEIPELKYVSPRNKLGGWNGAETVTRGLKSGAYDVFGDYPEIINQEPMLIIEGRFINYSDIKENRKVAVIGKGVKKELYDYGEPILGSYIKIDGVNFKVIGLIERTSVFRGTLEQAQKAIHIPFTAYGRAFNSGDVVGWMSITAKDGYPITDLRPKVFEIIKKRHRIHPDDPSAIGNFDVFSIYSKITGLFAALDFVAYLVGLLVLFSGVIGISNIMLIVVKERTKEIGIRRALGAKPWQIRGQIILESVFLTIIAGMAGIVFATLVLYGVNYFLDMMPPNSDMMFDNPNVNFITVLIALGILMLAGLFAGFIPAQNALSVKPVDALRTE